MHRKWFLVFVISITLCSSGVGAVLFNSPQITTVSSAFITFDLKQEVTIDVNTTGVAVGHELLWIANTTGTNYEESAVTVAEGIAYIGSCSTHGDGHDTVFAVNISTGEILWSHHTGPGYVGPVVDEKQVYYGTCSHGYDPDNEYLYAFNRSTGTETWNLKIYSGIAESIQYDKINLYFASSAGVAYAVNKENGSVKWTRNLMAGDVVTKPLLKDQMLYFACFGAVNHGTLFRLAADDGHEIWRKNLPGGPWDNSLTADGQGRIFLAIYGSSSIYAYHEENGSMLWEYQLHAPSLSFNAYHNNMVFIADTEGYVYALSANQGFLIWETKIGGTCDISSPTLSDGLLFIGTRDYSDGAFYALNESTGALLWRYPIGASVTCPPTVVGGMMLCGSDGWNMYAFDIGTGNDNWMLHRYDTWNTAYSPTGLNQWESVQAACSSQQGIITCRVTNQYDHGVKNITLHLPFAGYWYTETEELLKENAESFTLDSLAGTESVTLLITQEPLFKVTITRPVEGIYLMNTKILRFFFPVVLGIIDLEATVHTINETQVDRVEFYIDNELQGIDTSIPYNYRWGHSFGFHQINVVAYQKNLSVNEERLVLKIL